MEYRAWPTTCMPGTTMGQVFPAMSCYNTAKLDNTGNLSLDQRGLVLGYQEYCLAPADLSLGREDTFIQACLPSNKQSVPSYYSYILSFSIFCLLFVLIICLTSPELYSITNQIIFHLSATMVVAYLALIFIQRPELLEELLTDVELGSWGCLILGYTEQFSFISSFVWMTLMSLENLHMLDGSSQATCPQKSSNTMKKLVVVGYGAPLLLCLVTAGVELLGPACAEYKARFGHR